MLERLKELLALERLSVEGKLEADQILLDLAAELDLKEVYVPEPEDLDKEEPMVWTAAQLNRLREGAVVAIANDLGLEASIRDRKADTVQKILDAQEAPTAE